MYLCFPRAAILLPALMRVPGNIQGEENSFLTTSSLVKKQAIYPVDPFDTAHQE
jgi:hypothetical protein